MTYLGVHCEHCNQDTIPDHRGYCLWCQRKPDATKRRRAQDVARKRAWRAGRERRLAVSA